MSARLSVNISSAPTERIATKLYTGELVMSVYKAQILLKSGKKYRKLHTKTQVSFVVADNFKSLEKRSDRKGFRLLG
jgi:hypothetical protein